MSVGHAEIQGGGGEEGAGAVRHVVARDGGVAEVPQAAPTFNGNVILTR